MASNNNSKKNRNQPQHEQGDPYDPQIARSFRKEKKRSRRREDKHILKDFPDAADEYFEREEKY